MKSVSIIRLSGKARLVFECFAALAEKQGDRTLGEIVKGGK